MSGAIQPRKSRRTPKGWRKIFLAALAELFNVEAAAMRAGISRNFAYRQRAKDKKFASAWDEAITVSAERLEAVAYQRAVHGTLKPVFQGGVQVGVVREYSDHLTTFLLKHALPGKYGDKQILSGDVRVEVEYVNQPPPPPADEAADFGIEETIDDEESGTADQVD